MARRYDQNPFAEEEEVNPFSVSLFNSELFCFCGVEFELGFWAWSIWLIMVVVDFASS